MIKVNSEELVNLFSDSYFDILEKYKEIRNIVGSLNLNQENTISIDNSREELNETVGDFMELFLNTISKTKLPNKWVREDNEALKRNGIDEILGYNERENPEVILEKAIFETYEDGLCARMAHISNIVKHDLEMTGIIPVAKKMGVNSKNINTIRARFSKGDNSFEKNEIIDTIKYANSEFNKNNLANINVVEEALNNPKDEKNKRVIEKVQSVMKQCGVPNLSINNTNQFIKLIKCYKLSNYFTNLKEQGIRGCIYNIQAKDILAQKRLSNNPNADISDLEQEVLVGYYTESTDDFTIQGKPAIRMVIAGKNDRFSMQFHQSKYSMDKLKKDYDFKVEENEELRNKLNLVIPYSDEKDMNRIEGYKAHNDRNIFQKLKDVGFGVYNIIKKGYLGKLVSINKEESIEKTMEESVR